MTNKSKSPLPFHKRWNIEIGLEQAKDNFIHRALNLVEIYFPSLEAHWSVRPKKANRMLQLVATELGLRYDENHCFSSYASSDFLQSLHALEALRTVTEVVDETPGTGIIIDAIAEEVISKSEVDLGIEWKGGVFKPAGAKLLDEELINEPLQWLDDPKYKNVLEPFKKGLSDYMEAQKNTERLSDTVTDMYEALEAMAKVATGKDDDLSGNRELFISKLKLSDHYKKMLKDYIEYACEFRHGVEPTKKRKPPKPNEVESFIYMTGLFIRLAIRQQAT